VGRGREGRGARVPRPSRLPSHSRLAAVSSSRPPLLLRPPKARSPWLARFRGTMFHCVQHGAFEGTVIALILLNGAFMALKHYPQAEPQWDATQEVANAVFTAAFGLEMVMKVIGLGWGQYIRSWSNRFDALLVAGSILSAVFSVGGVGNMLRILRIARLFRLVRLSAGLQRLLRTFVFSLPIFANVRGGGGAVRHAAKPG